MANSGTGPGPGHCKKTGTRPGPGGPLMPGQLYFTGTFVLHWCYYLQSCYYEQVSALAAFSCQRCFSS